MKTLKRLIGAQIETQVIARFGEARLLCHRGGHYEVVGGSPTDELEAREWVAHFLHEAFPSRGGWYRI